MSPKQDVLTLVLAGMTFALSGCHSASQPPRGSDSSSGKAISTKDNRLPYLADAEDRLTDAMQKPAAPFHLSLKKVQSDGFSSQCEADVSADGIAGQKTDVVPTSRVGNTVFPARTDVKQLKGTPLGSRDWEIVRTGIVLTFLNRDLQYGQPGLKYVGEEQTGGYDARRYDFDLASVPPSDKAGVLMGSNALGTISGGGGPKLTDYNVKGSAWLSKEDGRLVMFHFDYIMISSDGANATTHYDGIVTRKQ